MISAEVHDIVKCVYTDKRIKEFISKLKPASLQDDLMMHCISEIYRVAELYPGKIEGLQERKQMFAWFVGMAKIQLMSKRSTFYRRHRREFDDEKFIGLRPAMPDYYEFPVIDPEKERLIEWAYTQIEKAQKINAKWLNTALINGEGICEDKSKKKDKNDSPVFKKPYSKKIKGTKEERISMVNGQLFDIIDLEKEIPPTPKRKRYIPTEENPEDKKNRKSYSRTGNFGVLMMEATPFNFRAVK